MSKIFPLRLSEEEKSNFQSAADKEGMNLSQWLRRAATRTAELEESNRVVEHVSTTPGAMHEYVTNHQSVQEVKDRIYPQSRQKCPHRLNPGAWCKTCKKMK